ncbi:MAG: cytochrome o ubiquinol oxidase protein CyoD [Chlamydiota bacterium]|jgi:cytochrome o ubiquinol oxidase operon protein cyoD
MTHQPEKIPQEGTLRTYWLGLLVCTLLTLTAFYIVDQRVFNSFWITTSIVVLAVIQTFVQLILFLHLGQEAKPKWNFMLFLFMALVLIIVVIGSLWIMYNLNYRMM